MPATIIRLFLIVCAAAGLLAQPAAAQITNPRDYSGLVLWTDANDVNGNGVQPANGATVSTWVDKSGTGHNLTSAVSTAPSFQTTGFDSVNPGLRFTTGKTMAGANPFGTSWQNAITFFFIAANNTATNNGAFSLNGNNDGYNAYPNPGGRYSMHIPWASNNTIFFDAGGCCGSHRLQGPYPSTSTITDTMLYVGQSDGTTGNLLLRVNGSPFASATTASQVDVSGGVFLSANVGFASFDGRFGEIIVYNRALSLSEIQYVECYLLEKWKPSYMPSSCKPAVTMSKSSTPWDDGVNPVYNLPGNDVTYTITVNRGPGVRIGRDSVFAYDAVPANMTFYNGDADGAGPGTTPVLFSGAGSGLTFTYATDARYSNAASPPANFAACTYTPTAGYDVNVRYVCLNPKGYFSSGGATSSITFTFRARIR